MKKTLLKNALCVLAGIGIMSGTASASIFGPSAIEGSAGVLNMLNSDYFSGNFEVVATPFDFQGLWEYTAFAYEAAHLNIVKEKEKGTGAETTFRTSNTDNFGQYELVDFDTQNLKFKDVTDKEVGSLDRYTSRKLDYFHFYQLTEDSNLLSGNNWFDSGYNFTLEAGTYILGFNDNFGTGDCDYDDIIVAMRPVMTPVPEPATMLLFGTGLAGLVGIARKKRGTQY